MPVRAWRSASMLGALVAMVVAAACSSSSRGGSGDGGEGVASDGSADGDDAASSSGGADATSSGSSSGGPPADMDAPLFSPDGCALLNTPCTMGSQCCSGLCPIPQLVCTLPPNHP